MSPISGFSMMTEELLQLQSLLLTSSSSYIDKSVLNFTQRDFHILNKTMSAVSPIFEFLVIPLGNRTKYSRMDQVQLVEDSL